MDYAEKGDLFTEIKKKREAGRFFTEAQIIKWTCQMILALNYMHNKMHILHRDLKPQNIFLDAQDNVQIGDMGISKIMSNTQDLAKTTIGTPYYLSPEMVNNQPYSWKSDIWSLGCLLWEMGMLTPLFGKASNLAQLMIKIATANLPPMPHRFSAPLKHVCQVMLAKDPKRRPGCDVLLEAPVLAPVIAQLVASHPGADGKPVIASAPPTAPGGGDGANAGGDKVILGPGAAPFIAQQRKHSLPEPGRAPVVGNHAARQSSSREAKQRANGLLHPHPWRGVGKDRQRSPLRSGESAKDVQNRGRNRSVSSHERVRHASRSPSRGRNLTPLRKDPSPASARKRDRRDSKDIESSAAVQPPPAHAQQPQAPLKRDRSRSSSRSREPSSARSRFPSSDESAAQPKQPRQNSRGVQQRPPSPTHEPPAPASPNGGGLGLPDIESPREGPLDIVRAAKVAAAAHIFPPSRDRAMQRRASLPILDDHLSRSRRAQEVEEKFGTKFSGI